MTGVDERVWLRHKETGHSFHCPAGAVDDWAEMGWEPGEPPEEVNPVVAERLAWEAEQLAAAQAAEQSKTSRKGGTADMKTQEG